MKPLTSGAHIAQVQLQEECAEANTCILQSYVPECKKSSYFLIQKNNCFFSLFKIICDAVLNNEQIKCIPCQDMNRHCKKLQETLTNHVPDFETLLPLRQWANEIASSCTEVAFSPV